MIRNHDDTVDRQQPGDDEDHGAGLHARHLKPVLWVSQVLAIRCIEWSRRRAIATDFNLSDAV